MDGLFKCGSTTCEAGRDPSETAIGGVKDYDKAHVCETRHSSLWLMLVSHRHQSVFHPARILAPLPAAQVVGSYLYNPSMPRTPVWYRWIFYSILYIFTGLFMNWNCILWFHCTLWASCSVHLKQVRYAYLISCWKTFRVIQFFSSQPNCLVPVPFIHWDLIISIMKF